MTFQSHVRNTLPTTENLRFFPEDVNMTLPIPELYDRYLGNPTFAGPTDFWMATLLAWRTGHNTIQPNLVAEVFITYFSACRATNNNTGTPNDKELLAARLQRKNWRAFKGVFELCIQNLTTSIINGATNTSILNRADVLPWVTSEGNEPNISYPYAAYDSSSTRRQPYSVDAQSLRALGDVMRLTLNGSTIMRENSERRWENSAQIILAQDIYSGHPQICIPSQNNDIWGFRNRMQNIAISLTNAYVYHHI